MARIFISYSRADRQFLDSLVPLIRKVYGNDSLWYDDDIHGGADWWPLILSEIDDCDLFIYLVSNESLSSEYCQAEFEEALRLRKQILPIIVRLKTLYPGEVIPHHLAVVLRRTQYVDLAEGFHDPTANASLYAAVNHLLAQVPPHPPEPLYDEPVRKPKVQDKPAKRLSLRLLAVPITLLLLIVAGILLLVIINRPSAQTPTPGTSPPTVDLMTAAYATRYADQTRVALLPTLEPSPNVTQTLAALATKFFIEDQTATAQYHIDQTATAQQWTATPAPSGPGGDPITSNAQWQHLPGYINGISMVMVPRGCFTLGSEQGFINEKPVRHICFDSPFYIGRCEVSNAQYQSCVQAHVCDHVDVTSQFSGPLQPVMNVTWEDAIAFCAWHDLRLPTEAEWEYAARGPYNLVYPWGNDFVDENVVYSVNSNGATTNVSVLPDGQSWVGAYHMSGNVWEWTSSIYRRYPYFADDGREDMSQVDAARVMRGGGYSNTSDYVRAAIRLNYSLYNTNPVGIRCARDFE